MLDSRSGFILVKSVALAYYDEYYTWGLVENLTIFKKYPFIKMS